MASFSIPKYNNEIVHKVIDADDDPTQDLSEYFKEMNEFIDKNL